LPAVESLRDAEENLGLRDPAPTSDPLAGVVLCGGRSRRMGVDKATIEVGGSTLLERAISRLREVCDPVLIAPGDLHLASFGYEIVEDAVPGAGPLAALVAVLRRGPHPLIAVVAVDMPWLDPALLRLLAARVGDHDVAVCETDRGVEPLHAVYQTSALGPAEAAMRGPDRSQHGQLGRQDVLTVAEREWRGAGIDPRFASNVNTQADLDDLRLELRRPGT
jgi:molybdopterin-guanine dinucleotide biosynthesis protein A